MNKSKYNIKPFGFRRYLDYFKENMSIQIKSFIEYKADLISSILASILEVIFVIFFLYLLKSNFSNLFYWSYHEILFFILCTYSISFFSGVFWQSRKLSEHIIQGRLNIYLIRPINVFYQYLLFDSRIRRFLNASLFFIALIVVIIYYSIDLSINIIVFPYIFFACCYAIIFFRFIDSLAFIMKRNTNLSEMVEDCEDMLYTFPYPFFKNMNYSALLSIFPVVYYSSYITEFFFFWSN